MAKYTSLLCKYALLGGMQLEVDNRVCMVLKYGKRAISHSSPKGKGSFDAKLIHKGTSLLFSVV